MLELYMLLATPALWEMLMGSQNGKHYSQSSKFGCDSFTDKEVV